MIPTSAFAPGLLVAMASAPDGGGAAPWLQLIPFVLVLGIFYFIILLPMRRRQKKVDEFLGALKVGDKVVTSGGLYGSVTRIGDGSLQLQIADKVRVEISRNAIVGYQGQAPVVAPEGASQ
jgi:preprotein translocase subunit YajC